MKLSSGRAYEFPVLIDLEVYGSERIFTVVLILHRLVVHRELHELFHPVFFAEQIIVQTSISSIRQRIERIMLVYGEKFVHQRDKTIHIGGKLKDVASGDILVADGDLIIVSGKQLVVAHIVFLHPKKRCVFVGLGITVPCIAADFDVLCVLL